MTDPRNSEKSGSADVVTESAQLAAALEGELAHARASWSVFMSGNGLKDGHRSSLRNLLDGRDEAVVFNHLMRATATMTVMSIARLTDPYETDRLTMSRLKSLLGKNFLEEFVREARSWFPDWKEKCDLEERRTRTQLPLVHSRICKFLDSQQIARIRALRDEAVAHRLRISTIRPTFNDIGWAFDEAHSICSAVSLLARGTSWDPEDFIRLPLNSADAFWDAFERGLAEAD